MDPLTSAFNLANSIVTLATKVFDAMPEADKATGASDIAKTLHNVSVFIQGEQQKLNAAVKP